MARNLYLIFGPPGSGKTSQAIDLARSLRLDHLSWGTIDRDPAKRVQYRKLFEVIDKKGTEDKSRSRLIGKIVEAEIKLLDKQCGLVLDGFPRRLDEAKDLVKITKRYGFEIKAVIRVNPSLESAFDRFNKRHICKRCKTLYDDDLNPAKLKGKCDIDGQNLYKKKTPLNEIEKDFLSYLSESVGATNHLRPYAEMYFDVSGDDEDMLVHSNILMKLKAHQKNSFHVYQRQSSANLETKFGKFKMITYLSRIDYCHQLAIVKGKVENNYNVLVRVHSSCITGDIFNSEKCDCGAQLHEALRLIEHKKNGVLIYLFQEGRGINIVNKLFAYDLQSQGLDTVEANEKLGFPAEMRKYEAVKDILDDLRIKSINLITNNPDKINKLTDLGVVVQQTTGLEIKPGIFNSHYLQTKKNKMGHRLSKYRIK
jgi:3,4-dihydroxy 2-butanone 4-phosphate synthase/GTP cyclohydrolase II